MAEATRTAPAGVLCPRPLFAGAVVSFAACCLAGRLSGGVNCYDDFRRFHPHMNHQSLHYPTVAHVRALARATLDPRKTVVVVGGNSVLYGSCVGDPDVWTVRLGELLGEDYQVLNLALNGVVTWEFGATAAEVLMRDFPRLVFVSDCWVGPGFGLDDPDGRPFIRYFFWEARARGWLLDDPAREEVIRAARRARDESFAELRRQSALDCRLSFRDLWTAAEYRHLTTTWSPLLGPRWWRARRGLSAPPTSPLPPAEVRARWAEPAVKYLREVLALHRDLAARRGTRDWSAPPPGPLEEASRTHVPEALRSRTLMLVAETNPSYLARLSDSERAEYSDLAAQTVAVLRRCGMASMEVGRGYAPDDYFDAMHLTKEGGRRMAAEVAPRVRALAGQLGYARGGGAEP